MPTIDIPDTLAFTKLEALKALEIEVNRQQQAVKQNMRAALRGALTAIDAATDEQVATVVNNVRDNLATLRQEFVRLGRVEADFRQQWTAAGGV